MGAGKRSLAMKYVLGFVLGAIGGGIMVARATDAIPKMMHNMMSRMAEEGHSPMEMWQKIMGASVKPDDNDD